VDRMSACSSLGAREGCLGGARLAREDVLIRVI
jgi:hypothetical protein